MKNVGVSVFLLMMCVFQIHADDNSEMAFMEAVTKEGGRVELFTSSIEAKVNIVGVIADVTTIQTFKNTTDDTLDARYVFPGSTTAAVYGMEMKIGERTIIAKIKEKEVAKQEFEKAKEEGKTASLLEQHRPNVFQTSVGNLLPNQEIKVVLHYTELIKPKDGVYEFVYPTTVGERYSGESNGEESWLTAPGIVPNEGEVKVPKITIDINLHAPIPLHGVNVTTHKSAIDFVSKKKATISYSSSTSGKNVNDFILRYKLKGDKIETGLSLFEGEDENFFLYMGQSPKRVTPEMIPPREYYFIVDVSGSMDGTPLDISKKMMKELLSDLKSTDKFNIMLFASSSSVFSSKPVAATTDNIQDGISFVENGANGSGGTNMLSAMKRAFEMTDKSNSTSMVILTDGYINVEKDAFEFIKNNLGESNFFSFGIGGSVNRYLIEGMAHIGRSEPFIITDYTQAERQAETFKKYISSPVLTNVQLTFEDFDAYDLTPTQTPDLMAEKPVIVFGKWKGEPKGKLILNGSSGTGDYELTTKVSKKLVDEDNVALRSLWARDKIKTLSDYEKVSKGSDLKQEITDLGLRYSLLTDYTSFVAIDDAENLGEQPENEPHNSPSGGVPEPHEWLMILVVFAVLGWYVYGYFQKQSHVA